MGCRRRRRCRRRPRRRPRHRRPRRRPRHRRPRRRPRRRRRPPRRHRHRRHRRHRRRRPPPSPPHLRPPEQPVGIVLEAVSIISYHSISFGIIRYYLFFAGSILPAFLLPAFLLPAFLLLALVLKSKSSCEFLRIMQYNIIQYQSYQSVSSSIMQYQSVS